MTSPAPGAEEAITAALVNDWKKAVAVNSAILKESKSDIDAMCRLGFAYMKTGQMTAAKRIYQKVLTIDKYNQIATKNLKRLASMKKKDVGDVAGSTMSPMIFLEEPGKTKIVECVHVAPSTVLSTLSAGEEVVLKVKQHGVDVRMPDQTYVAALPDDMSFRLGKMIAGGNTYQAIIKSVDKKSVKVLIRELTRGKKFAKQPSFTTTTSYVSFAKTSHENPDMTATGEDGEESSMDESEDV